MQQQQMPIEYLTLPKYQQRAIETAYDRGQHLYFILSRQHDQVKIGVARNPSIRLKTLQTGSPTQLELLFVIPYGGYLIESLLHKQFKELRLKGEWYTFAAPIKEYIEQAKEIVQDVGLRWSLEANRMET